MPKETLQEKFKRALIQRGEIIVASKSRKYITLTARLLGDNTKFFFLGKSGALRQGRTQTGSYPVTDTLRNQLLKDQ